MKRLLYSLFGKRQRTVNNVINEKHLARLEEQVNAVFASVGTMSWTSFVQNRLPILELPENVLEAVRSGELAYTKGRLIAKVEDKARRGQLLKEALEEELSGARLRRRIAEIQGRGEEEANLQERAAMITKALKNKHLLDDKKTLKKIERLLSQLEALLVLEAASKKATPD